MNKLSIVAVGILMILLAGCGDLTALPDTGAAEEETTTTANSPITTGSGAEENEPGENEPLEGAINVHVSNNRYDNLWSISEEYLIFEENNRYGVIDKEENIIFPAEYDSFHVHLQDKSFMLYVKEGDTKHNVLYDKNLNVIYEEDSEYYISSYSENIICMTNDEETSRKYLNAENDFEIIAVLDSDVIDGYSWSSPCNNGLIVIADYMYDDQGFDNMMNTSGRTIKLPMLEDETFVASRWNSINREGWFAVDAYYISDGTTASSGFYNI